MCRPVPGTTCEPCVRRGRKNYTCVNSDSFVCEENTWRIENIDLITDKINRKLKRNSSSCQLESVGEKGCCWFSPLVREFFISPGFYPASRGFSLVFLSVVLPFSSLFWLFLCRGKDLCRQPFGIPVEHAH